MKKAGYVRYTDNFVSVYLIDKTLMYNRIIGSSSSTVYKNKVIKTEKQLRNITYLEPEVIDNEEFETNILLAEKRGEV